MADTKSPQNKEKSEAEEDAANTPSELDPETHTELRILYEESTKNILFAKSMQWGTVGSTLVLFVALIGIAVFVSKEAKFLGYLQGIIFIAGPAAIFLITLYQFWQHAEQQKLLAVERHFSSLFRDIRKIKSTTEANIHRYVTAVRLTERCWL